MHYNKSYRLLYTVVVLKIQTENDEKVNNWCYKLFSKKREIQKLVSTTSESNINTISSQNNNDQENAIDKNINLDKNIFQDENGYVQVTNPKVIATKGQPSRRQKTVLELED
ncbi:hypothetical protein F8M41_025679 [Gigaspora margarita]|uniref:Uncharacterized protein n=1 Tax=Gigaspora margarita TaxID=4874 RepID=A0A8H4AZW4_GIGMA|nr:hypothetical protein F8M41_025679 [Gigaspora margarita]